MRKSIKSRLVKLAFNPTLIIVLSIINLVLINNYHNSNNVSALEYQSNTGVEFTINPTITISITGDHNGNLVINNLTPSNASDSNIINIVTESNAISGYSLYSTVGSDGSSNNGNGTSTGNPSTELRRNGTDTTNKFTSITTNKSSLSDFNGSDWGYSYSTDSGTTWISGDITSTTATGYNGLPLYTTESPIKLINTTTSGSSSVQFKIGAKASNSQIAGDYTNTINFIGVAKPNPQPIYIQDLTLANCQVNVGTNGNPENVGDEIIVTDKRDYNSYTVRYINGACWMTQNLRITGIISAKYSNFTGEDINISQVDLDQTMGTCSGTDCNSYSVPMTHSSNDMAIGAWYNYVAATAGTIIGDSNPENAIESVCPSGWRLPTHSEQLAVVNYSSVYKPILSYTYYNGAPTGDSSWYSRSANGSTNRYGLFYDDDILRSGSVGRTPGRFVRCVHN